MRVHLLSLPRPQARARLLVLHGAGGHSGALWPLAALAAAAGYEVLAPDLPGYGLTDVPDPAAIIYPHWVDCVADLLRAQSAADGRPLVVLGGSMGGLLGYSASARVPIAVSHLVVTCLLDPSNPLCWPALSRWGGAPSVRLLRPLMSGLAGGRGLARLRLPMRWVAPMSAIASDPALARLCAMDARGGGSRVSLGFLASYLFSTPEVAPKDFREVPVTLIHPTQDRWTPPAMSLAFLREIAGPTRHVPLEGCGHFPVEEPGLARAAEVLREVLEEVVGSGTREREAG
jgi:alpha-beta hydrolase superfamily lysophospholipase